jgi:hypothetical protein
MLDVNNIQIDRTVLTENDIREFREFVKFYASQHNEFHDHHNPGFTKPLERLHTALRRHYNQDNREIFERSFVLMQALIAEVMKEQPEFKVEKTSFGSRYYRELPEDDDL